MVVLALVARNQTNAKSTMGQEILLVGSVPLKSVEDVMMTFGGAPVGTRHRRGGCCTGQTLRTAWNHGQPVRGTMAAGSPEMARLEKQYG